MSENRLDKFKTALNGVKVPILVLDKKWYILRQKAGTTNEINALEKELKELLKRQGKLTNDLNSIKKIKKDKKTVDKILFFTYNNTCTCEKAHSNLIYDY